MSASADPTTVLAGGDPEGPYSSGPAAALAGQVARLFFDGELSKIEIAARLGISRFRVARLLERARADGIVRIEFRDAPAQERALARAIEHRFGLDLCVVASTGSDGTGAAARLAADVVDGLLGSHEAIGIAWGSTVARVIQAIPARRDPTIDVVQLAGSSTGMGAGTAPADLVRTLAERLGGRPHSIHAPTFVESAALGAALRREPDIAATMSRHADLSIALLGIGAFGLPIADVGGIGRDAVRSSLLRSGALGPLDLRALAAAGAVGDLLVHPFDADGRFVAPDLTARAIGIGVEDLRRVPRVVAVAAGADKGAAILGALSTGVISILVTDAAAATWLVEAIRS